MTVCTLVSFAVSLGLLRVVWSEQQEIGEEQPTLISTWRDINISLPKATAHQVIGYYASADRVYLVGGDNIENEYWSLQFNESYNGWSRNEKMRFEDLKIMEYSQSFFSSRHNIIYIKTNEYIHIFDMEIDYFNENVIKLPVHLTDGCMTVYYEASKPHIEYLIVVGSKTSRNDGKPTTWIYKVDQQSHNITFFDIGPDLIGERENHCCTVMEGHLYVMGGLYDEETRFVEQWQIDIDDEYDESVTSWNNFTNIETLIDTDIAASNLPQFGHRCIVNEDKQQMYVVGGITDEHDAFFNYSSYIFVLERHNDTLFEVNYRETEQQEEESGGVHGGSVLPSMPVEMAYTAAMIDRYGYLNLFGGQLSNEQVSNAWYRINTLHMSQLSGNELDVIWQNHTKHNHNEQWALLILLIMIIVIALWFKCIAKLKQASNNTRNGIHGDYTDTAYDEVTGTSEIDDLEETEDADMHQRRDKARHSLSDSDDDDQIYSNLKGIIASDVEQDSQVVM